MILPIQASPAIPPAAAQRKLTSRGSSESKKNELSLSDGLIRGHIVPLIIHTSLSPHSLQGLLLVELPPIYRVQQPLNHLTGQVS